LQVHQYTPNPLPNPIGVCVPVYKFLAAETRRVHGPRPFSRGYCPEGTGVCIVLGALLHPSLVQIPALLLVGFQSLPHPSGLRRLGQNGVDLAREITLARARIPQCGGIASSKPLLIFISHSPLFSFPFLLALACPSRTDPPLRLTCIPAPPRVPAYP